MDSSANTSTPDGGDVSDDDTTASVSGSASAYPSVPSSVRNNDESSPSSAISSSGSTPASAATSSSSPLEIKSSTASSPCRTSSPDPARGSTSTTSTGTSVRWDGWSSTGRWSAACAVDPAKVANDTASTMAIESRRRDRRFVEPRCSLRRSIVTTTKYRSVAAERCHGPDATVPGPTIDPGTVRTVGTERITTTRYIRGQTPDVTLGRPRGPAAAMTFSGGWREFARRSSLSA